MTTSQQTTSLRDQMRETELNKHVEGVATIQDTARSGSPDPAMGQNENKDETVATILPLKTAHRPFAYPAWPTSKPGPLATSPLPGQHPHLLRTDQMVYECYDQEQDGPCVLPPRLAVRENRTRMSLSDANLRKGTLEAEVLARWLDDGGRPEAEAMSDVEGVSPLPLFKP